jgi:ABC-type ATPase with predicted acetyltransferase domain
LGQQDGSAGANSLAVLSEQERLEVVRLVKSLRDWTDQLSLNDVQKAEYEADISTIEAQMDSSRPKTNLIEAILGSIKHTVEEAQHPSGSVADIVSAGIVSTIDRFVARF